MGTKQLVGTIEKVETHDPDPTASPPRDPWETVAEDMRGLMTRLREVYRNISNERGPSENEIRDAIGTLLAAWDKVAEAVSNALTEPEVREGLKEAASSLATALGSTISELGQELRAASGSSEEE